MSFRHSHPRRQAFRLAELASREGPSFRRVLLGKRGTGKSDLLRQVYAQLFASAEGPIPVLSRWERGRDDSAAARHFFASFCQQVRAFLLRQEELFGEPVGPLERELERPGLPLSLAEMAQNFLAAPERNSMALVAGLPAQFARLERRPVCWLLDDAHEFGRTSPVFGALDSPDFSWLLSGRQPFLLRLAGESAWPTLDLEPFSPEESLGLAEDRCREAGLPFAREGWEQWLGVTGATPWLIGAVVDAAVVHGQSLGTAEELARVYVGELATGTLGNWLAARFEQAVPDPTSRGKVGRFLAGLVRTGLPAPALSLAPEVWDGLVAEEWAVETPLGPRVQLEPVQWDWLWLVSASLDAPSQRVQARALQTFLLRAEQRKQRLRESEPFALLRQRLLELPERGFPADFDWTGGEKPPLQVCSVAVERSASGELFWCYGLRKDSKGVPASVGILLIILCEKDPVPREVAAWRRQLEQEERLLPARAPGAPTPAPPAEPWGEIWLVLPSAVSPAPEGADRYFAPESFLRRLDAGAASERLD